MFGHHSFCFSRLLLAIYKFNFNFLSKYPQWCYMHTWGPEVVHLFCIICKLPVYVNLCSVFAVFIPQDYRRLFINSISVSFQIASNVNTYICEVLKWYTFFVLYVNYPSMSISVRSSQCLFFKITIRHI